jgi:hypothetical protein
VRARITKRVVDGLKPAETDYYVFDTDTIGFAVRVRATGGMSTSCSTRQAVGEVPRHGA